MSVPYTAEQRLAHDNHHPYTLGCAICRDLMADDAARAAAPSVVDEFHVTTDEQLRAASPEPTPGLPKARETLNDLLVSVRKWAETDYGDVDEFEVGAELHDAWRSFREHEPVVRAALAASPAPEPTGLDAEAYFEKHGHEPYCPADFIIPEGPCACLAARLEEPHAE